MVGMERAELEEVGRCQIDGGVAQGRGAVHVMQSARRAAGWRPSTLYSAKKTRARSYGRISTVLVSDNVPPRSKLFATAELVEQRLSEARRMNGLLHYVGRSRRYVGRSRRYVGRSRRCVGRSRRYVGRSRRYVGTCSPNEWRLAGSVSWSGTRGL
jgi:hypothetical protein